MEEENHIKTKKKSRNTKNKVRIPDSSLYIMYFIHFLFLYHHVL